MINQKKELQGIGMSLSMLTRYERARSILVRYGHMLKPKCGENDHIIRNDTVYPHWISHGWLRERVFLVPEGNC